MQTILKVGAFIVRPRDRDPHQLLLFAHHDLPDVPLQIPGGTVEPGEDVDHAVRREIEEEAGLQNLRLMRKLGISKAPSTSVPGAVLERHCYLFQAPTNSPDSWIHTVAGAGEDQGLRFAYTWHTIDDPHYTLCGDLGYFLTPNDIPELYSIASLDRSDARIKRDTRL